MKRSLAVLIILSLALVGCGKVTVADEIDVSKLEYSLHTVKEDSETVPYINLGDFLYGTSTEEYDDSNDSRLGEIQLNDEAVSTYDVLENGDIVCGDITYTGLSDFLAANKIPCSDEAFINFIIDSMPADDNNIIEAFWQNDEQMIADGEENYLLVDEMISGTTGYDEIKDKYNGYPAVWQLTVMGGITKSFVGNEYYILCDGEEFMTEGYESKIPSEEYTGETVNENDETVEGEGDNENEEEDSVENEGENNSENEESNSENEESNSEGSVQEE